LGGVLTDFDDGVFFPTFRSSLVGNYTVTGVTRTLRSDSQAYGAFIADRHGGVPPQEAATTDFPIDLDDPLAPHGFWLYRGSSPGTALPLPPVGTLMLTGLAALWSARWKGKLPLE
jgi:hypothetical protein